MVSIIDRNWIWKGQHYFSSHIWLYLCAPTWKECAIFTRAGPLFLDFGVVKFRKWASPSPFLFLSQLIMRVCILLSTPKLKDLFPGKLIPNLMLYRFYYVRNYKALVENIIGFFLQEPSQPFRKKWFEMHNKSINLCSLCFRGTNQQIFSLMLVCKLCDICMTNRSRT